MRRVLLYLLISFAGFELAQAQNPSQIIRGNIVDKESRQPLAGANVVVVNSQPLLGTVTDVNGNFRIANVPVGRKALKVTYIGYNDIYINDVIVNSAKEAVLSIEMQEKIIQAKEVVISGRVNKAAPNNEFVMVSGRVFTIDQTNRYAGSLMDPSRMASNFAGVAGGGNDQRNDIIIRGNTPIGLLWRLEGADIPNPNHFSNQGANGGPVSILNTNTLSNSDFLTGAFPSEYGNAISGVFDLKMKNGNNEKHEFVGQMGFNGVELGAEGPVKKGTSSYLINYRYSTLAVFDKLGIKFGESGIPFYQDITYKFNFPSTKAGSFSVWGIGGMSSTKITNSDKTAEERGKLVYPQDLEFSSMMGATGITHLMPFSKTVYLKSVLSFSGERGRTKVDTLNALNEKFFQFGSNTSTSKIALHSFINKKVSARHALRFGIIVSGLFAMGSDSVYVKALNGFRKLTDYDKNAYQFQSYLNWNYRITNDIVFNSGIAYNHFLLNNSYAVEPRAGVKWSVSRSQWLSFGYGLHSQVQPLYNYFIKTLKDTLHNIYAETNKNMGMTKSHHFVIGYEKMFGEHIRFKTEVYYQYLYDLPVRQTPGYFCLINTGADYGSYKVDSLVNNGTGRNYGLEITIEKFFNKSYYFLVTSSFYQSEYKASDNIWRNTTFNGNYVVNTLAGKEFKAGKNGILSLSGKVTYAGGRRYVPVDEAASAVAGIAVYKEKYAYENRLPDFFRTDLRIGFKSNGKKVTQEWALEIQNILNTQNILTQLYNPSTHKVENIYQIGFFPAPIYRIYF